MIRFELDGKKYRIEWQHGWQETRCFVGPVDTTKDNFDSLTENKDYFIGWAYLHPKDNFCKETGRKISLSKAIQGWSRAHRSVVWAAYHGRSARSASRVKNARTVAA